MCLKLTRGREIFSQTSNEVAGWTEKMKMPGSSFTRGVPARTQVANISKRFARLRLILLTCGLLSIANFLPAPLQAQPARSLTLPPSITIVGTNDAACQESLAELQRLIREFAFVRGHRIYLVCDRAAWHSVMHHLTLEYGVIVSSRAAISDLHLRETWFYAEALRKGAERRTGENIYAHELGHFVCSCIDESTADKAAAQLLEDAKRNRFTATTRAGASQ
jgi:hypothetical protein